MNDVAWYDRQERTYKRILRILEHVQASADEIEGLFEVEPSFAPEVTILAESLSFAIAACMNLSDLMNTRREVWRSEHAPIERSRDV